MRSFSVIFVFRDFIVKVKLDRRENFEVDEVLVKVFIIDILLLVFIYLCN